MPKNILVINVDIRETRVALIESGIIAELHVERASTRGTLGNIFLGKVTRVLPGMQAAFIDIGLERAAFLHVEDLIRPDDFEAFLAGSKREDNEVVPAAEVAEAAPLETAQGRGSRQLASEPKRAPGGERGAAPAALEVSDAAEGFDESLEEASAEADESSDLGDESSSARSADESSEDAEADDAAEEDEEEASAHTDAELDEDEDRDDDMEGAAGVGEPMEPSADERAGSSEPWRADEPIEEKAWSEEASDEPSDEPRAAEPAAGPGERLAASQEGAPASVPSDRARRSSIPVHEPPDDLGSLALPVVEARPETASAQPPAAALRGSTHAKGEGRGPAGRSGASEQGAGRGHPSGRAGSGAPPNGARSGHAQGGRGSDVRTPRARRLGRHGQSQQKQRSGRNAGRGGRESVRLSRSTPIRDVVREGQEVIVQVSKEPIGTKGARVTSHVSLPGRYVVYMPTIDQIGISKRIGSEKERSRLREAIESMKPPSGGLIVRTVAEGLTKKQLKADVGYLVRLWGEIAKKRETVGKAPALLYQELDLVLKTARDLFTDEIDQIVIDDREQYHRLVRFVEAFMPERVKDVVLYSGDEPIFDAYGLEDEIARALSRKVPLPSGGYLIIDQAEALTAVDVNTGRFVGKGSKDLEDTLFKTNLEAIEEIAYQLRFRNLGGLIVLDLIDMEKASNREKIYRRLEELLQKDKAKTTLNRISELGLIEMTRKRTRESLGRLLHEPCFYCDGTGQLQSKQTVAYEILRQIRRDRATLPGYSVVVNAHPAVIDLMKGEEREAVQEAERRFMRRIELVPRKEYHLEQFDLAGK